MFDFENPFKEEFVDMESLEEVQDEAQVVEEETPMWQSADWEQITSDHAENAPDQLPKSYTQFDVNRIYKKARTNRRERTGIRAARYAMVAVGFAALAYLTREISWLAIVLGGISACTGLISAYGIGKYHEM